MGGWSAVARQCTAVRIARAGRQSTVNVSGLSTAETMAGNDSRVVGTGRVMGDVDKVWGSCSHVMAWIDCTLSLEEQFMLESMVRTVKATDDVETLRWIAEAALRRLVVMQHISDEALGHLAVAEGALLGQQGERPISDRFLEMARDLAPHMPAG